ncbi:hypothetical protein I4U23_002165 [Adineta vaga]|nr:hypothetical protein I4U23_002165 [Adineta vaga]
MFDDSCWHLLRMENADIILFLNDTNTNPFTLQYPPVESTIRARENIQAVINYESYSPQVIIKTRLDKPILNHNYSLQCNVRGNPIPRLLWSKNNHSSEYYPSEKQCKTPCRIYSIQTKYQSILYFHSLIHTDDGIYICHAENLLNHTIASISLIIDENKLINRSTMNITCNNFNFCHGRGQCLLIDNQLKCLCDSRYFGEQCETDYDEMMAKQYDIFLLFKSRFLTGTILILITFLLLFIAFVSCFLAKYKQMKRKEILRAKLSQKNIQRISEQRTKMDRQKTLSLPQMPVGHHRTQFNKHSLSMINEKNMSNDYHKEYLPLNIHQIQDLNSKSPVNRLILSESYLDFYQPDAESGLIQPLTQRKDLPKRHTQYTSSQNRFLLPRPIHHR